VTQAMEPPGSFLDPSLRVPSELPRGTAEPLSAARWVHRLIVAVSKVTTPCLPGSARWRAQRLPLLDAIPVTAREPFDSHEVTVATIVEDVR
jgi:hypothetical protein